MARSGDKGGTNDHAHSSDFRGGPGPVLVSAVAAGAWHRSSCRPFDERRGVARAPASQGGSSRYRDAHPRLSGMAARGSAALQGCGPRLEPATGFRIGAWRGQAAATPGATGAPSKPRRNDNVEGRRAASCRGPAQRNSRRSPAGQYRPRHLDEAFTIQRRVGELLDVPINARRKVPTEDEGDLALHTRHPVARMRCADRRIGDACRVDRRRDDLVSAGQRGFPPTFGAVAPSLSSGIVQPMHRRPERRIEPDIGPESTVVCRLGGGARIRPALQRHPPFPDRFHARQVDA